MTENSKINFEDTATAFGYMSDRDLKNAYLLFSAMNYPWMVRTGTFLTSMALKLKLPVKPLIKKTVFRHFCGGESLKGLEPRLQQLSAGNVKSILDYSVEGEHSEAGYEQALQEALRVADYAAQHRAEIPFCVIKMTGIGSFDLMAKKQEGKVFTAEEKARFARILERIDLIVARVAGHGLRFMIDAEESWIQKTVDEIAYDLMIKYNQERAVVYNTYQLYRHAAFDEMMAGFEKVRAKGAYFGAKLVRGAYMEKERKRAEDLGDQDPIQPTKEATDRDYNQALHFVVEHYPYFSVCAGTHNEQSCQLLTDLMRQKNIDIADECIYFAQLLGMSDNISFKLSDLGYNVAKYVPYGPVEKVMPYLFRRADENTSIAGQGSREFLLVQKELKRRKK